jgi:hypothetical protein
MVLGGGAKALAWRGGGMCVGLLVFGDDSGDGMRVVADGWGEKGIVRGSVERRRRSGKSWGEGLERLVCVGRDRFRFRVFLYFFSLSKLPPSLCVLWKLIFIGKNVAKSPNLVPQLLSFFCKFEFFFYFFGFFLSTSTRMRKIIYFNNNAWKVERVWKFKCFWNDAKNAKNDVNILKNIFFRFSLFFAILDFSKILSKR